MGTHLQQPQSHKGSALGVERDDFVCRPCVDEKLD